MVEDYFKNAAEMEKHEVRESPVLCEIAGVRNQILTSAFSLISLLMNKTLHRNAIAAFFPALILLIFSGCSMPRPGTGQVENGIRFIISRPAASSVAVVGDFNRWSPEQNPLSGPDRNGYWSATLDLQPGRYEYLFLVDGTAWTPDPSAVSAGDGMGGRNSVVFVGERLP